MFQLSTMRILSALFVIAKCANMSVAYRIQGREDENLPFVPFEKGFVQNVQDPTTASRTRVNQGYARSVLLGDGVGKNRLFSCPRMVGPSDDQEYYCSGKEHGYCDRRSGTCFCNEGYTGDSCEGCEPTHFEVGGLCYPKQICPNDCSKAGRCNYHTGTCECSDHREGDDCSNSRCSRFHRFCTHCNDDSCIECEEGFSVHKRAEHGHQCEPCWRFDPRCRDCDTDACTSCVDLLLLSIHRSGRRPQDPPLPIDELMRELSVTVPFGSQQNDAFDDAEHYFLVDPALVPLNESAVECHQGLEFDDSITCVPYNLTSHRMCGNHGTITFESPEYAIREDENQIRLTLQRSGGGVGEVAVSYSIYPITAGFEDMTSTAYYTANQTIVFRAGQIKASFLVTINDDRLMEANKTFSVHLSNPTGHARLGTQRRSIITIIDDDKQKTCSDETTLIHHNHDLGSAIAGAPFRFSVFAKTCAGNHQKVGDDLITVEAHKIGSLNVPLGFGSPGTSGSCNELDDLTHACHVNITASGKYKIDVYQLIPGGLRGFYYTDNYLSDERLDIVRTDAVVNFTWGTGAVTTFGRNFVSVRWEGYVRPVFSETYTFWLDIDDHARLWIDGILLIDSWVFAAVPGLIHADHDLVALKTHDLVLEYRDIIGNATAKLLWSSTSTPLTAIPSSSLFYKEHIKNSPFTLRVLPAGPFAKAAVAFGRGLHEGTAGNAHSFSIRSNDEFGNFRGWPLKDSILDNTRHLDQFHATAKLIDGGGGGLGNSLVPVLISHNHKTRVYEASYTPRTAGAYQLNITLSIKDGATDENHIFGSPFLVQTKPGATFAQESIAFGGFGHCMAWIPSPCSGMYHGLAGKNSTFTIQALDLNRNKRFTGGDEWKVIVSSTLKLDNYHLGIVEDHGNGTYTVDVAPTVSGSNDLSILLNGSPLKGSPFRMDVVHNQVVGSLSYLVDEDDVNQMIAMAENMILIQATDGFGNNAIHCNEFPFDTSILVDSEEIDHDKTRATYVGGGKYEVFVKPLKSGQINLSIKINGSKIKDSPFNATVNPGSFLASSSSASGYGIRRATAGLASSFVIQSKDAGGNNKVTDEALFDIYLVRVEQSETIATNAIDDEVNATVTQLFIGDGQYLVRYTATVSGQYMLHVKDTGGQEIFGSPFHVAVAPAEMSAPYSLVVGEGLVSGVAGEVAEVRVYGRDRFLNFVHHAAEKLEMSLNMRSRYQSNWEANEFDNVVGRQVIKQLAHDGGRGIFVLDYIPKFSGEYDLDIVTFSPGGLEASHYSSPDLSSDYLISTSLDKEVEKYWEGDPTGDIIGTKSHFGSVWNGKLVADHDEEYQIIAECNDGAYASLAINGEYVPWRSCYPMTTTSTTMRVNQAVYFTLKYKSLQGGAFVKLKWASPSVPMEMIPPRNLYHQVYVGNTTQHHPVIEPNQISPPQSNAVGIRNAIAGIEQNFLVESRDGFGHGDVGNLLLGGGTRVELDSVNYEDQHSVLQTTITDNGNGTYAVKYTPRTAGVYYLSVTIDGRDIKESPFLLSVEPGRTDPSNSILLGAEIEEVTGETIHLNVQTIDADGNKRHKGGDTILAALGPLSGEGSEDELHCKAEYVTDGLYAINCSPVSHAGDYILNVDIVTSSGGESIKAPIKSSPFQVTISPGDATPRNTEVISGGSIVSHGGRNTVKFTSKVGLYETFLVSAKDLFGNALNTGGNHFVAKIRGDINVEPFEKHLEVIDQGNGNYVVAYRMRHPSNYEIDVSMVTASGLLGEFYMNGTSFKHSVSEKKLADEQINFNIMRLGYDSLFRNIRWWGYISFPETSSFQFELSGVEGHCKLWIGEVGVLDTEEETAFGNFGATENILYEIKIEYSLDTNRLLLKLFWSSRKMKRQIVPKHNLFASIEHIRGSPFQLTVTE